MANAPTTTMTSWTERGQGGHAELHVAEAVRDPGDDPERPDHDQDERLADQVGAHDGADRGQAGLRRRSGPSSVLEGDDHLAELAVGRELGVADGRRGRRRPTATAEAPGDADGGGRCALRTGDGRCRRRRLSPRRTAPPRRPGRGRARRPGRGGAGRDASEAAPPPGRSGSVLISMKPAPVRDRDSPRGPARRRPPRPARASRRIGEPDLPARAAGVVDGELEAGIRERRDQQDEDEPRDRDDEPSRM